MELATAYRNRGRVICRHTASVDAIKVDKQRTTILGILLQKERNFSLKRQRTHHLSWWAKILGKLRLNNSLVHRAIIMVSFGVRLAVNKF